MNDFNHNNSDKFKKLIKRLKQINPLYDLANYKRLIEYEPLNFSSIWSQL